MYSLVPEVIIGDAESKEQQASAPSEPPPVNAVSKQMLQVEEKYCSRIRHTASMRSPTVSPMKREEVPVSSSARVFQIHGLLTPEECLHYIRETEEIKYKDLTGEFDPSYRSNQRILVLSPVMADLLWRRIEPNLNRSDVLRIRPMCFGNGGTWRPYRLNECMKFGKYQIGQDFKRHIDGPWVPREDESSVYTVLIYLNDDFAGGSTTFHAQTPDGKAASTEPCNEVKEKHFGYDELANGDVRIKPTTGTALIFNHDCLHSGLPVIDGSKYVLRTEIMFRRIDTDTIPESMRSSYEKDPNYQRTLTLYQDSYAKGKKGDVEGFTNSYLEALRLQSEAQASVAADTRALHEMNLPLALYVHIFTFLEVAEISSVARTGKNWRDVSMDGSLWKLNYLQRYPIAARLEMQLLQQARADHSQREKLGLPVPTPAQITAAKAEEMKHRVELREIWEADRQRGTDKSKGKESSSTFYSSSSSTPVQDSKKASGHKKNQIMAPAICTKCNAAPAAVLYSCGCNLHCGSCESAFAHKDRCAQCKKIIEAKGLMGKDVLAVWSEFMKNLAPELKPADIINKKRVLFFILMENASPLPPLPVVAGRKTDGVDIDDLPPIYVLAFPSTPLKSNSNSSSSGQSFPTVDPAIRDWRTLFRQRVVNEKRCNAVIFDLGTFATKSAMTSPSNGRILEIESVVARVEGIFDIHMRRGHHSRYYVGQAARINHPNSLTHVFGHGNPIDSTGLIVELIATLYLSLQVWSNDHPVVIAEPPSKWSTPFLHQLSRALFFIFRVPAVVFVNSALLSLMSQQLESGIAVNIGAEATWVAGFRKRRMESFTDLSANIPSPNKERNNNKLVIEENQLNSYGVDNGHELTADKLDEMALDDRVRYPELPSAQSIANVVFEAYLRMIEKHSREIVELQLQTSTPASSSSSSQQFAIDFNKIVLSGGRSQAPGWKDEFQKELLALQYAHRRASSQSIPELEIILPEKPSHCVVEGGKVFASLGSFKEEVSRSFDLLATRSSESSFSVARDQYTSDDSLGRFEGQHMYEYLWCTNLWLEDQFCFYLLDRNYTLEEHSWVAKWDKDDLYKLEEARTQRVERRRESERHSWATKTKFSKLQKHIKRARSRRRLMPEGTSVWFTAQKWMRNKDPNRPLLHLQDYVKQRQGEESSWEIKRRLLDQSETILGSAATNSIQDVSLRSADELQVESTVRSNWGFSECNPVHAECYRNLEAELGINKMTDQQKDQIFFHVRKWNLDSWTNRYDEQDEFSDDYGEEEHFVEHDMQKLKEHAGFIFKVVAEPESTLRSNPLFQREPLDFTGMNAHSRASVSSSTVPLPSSTID